jgi:hypothetical protein
MTADTPEGVPLTWDQRELFAARYRRHASSGYCNICQVPAPCPTRQEARDRLAKAGLLDEHGHLRPGVTRRGPQ